MKMRVCSCYGSPKEVFSLTDDEEEFFNGSPIDFLRFVNDQIGREMQISKSFKKVLDVGESVEENMDLKKQLRNGEKE